MNHSSMYLRELKSCPNEYHIFENSVRPGIARSRDASVFLSLEVPNNDDRLGYTFCELNNELLKILTPKNGKIGKENLGQWNDWRIVTAIKGLQRDDISFTVYKVAIQHRATNKVLLYTVSNWADSQNKKTPSMEDGWFILHCDMIAPACFWSDIRSRL